jgi:hypothetical protein
MRAPRCREILPLSHSLRKLGVILAPIIIITLAVGRSLRTRLFEGSSLRPPAGSMTGNLHGNAKRGSVNYGNCDAISAMEITGHFAVPLTQREEHVTRPSQRPVSSNFGNLLCNYLAITVIEITGHFTVTIIAG